MVYRRQPLKRNTAYKSSAATFKRVMEIALIGLQWLTCLIYIDDIIAFGRYFKEHMRRIEDVLDRKKTAGLKQ